MLGGPLHFEMLHFIRRAKGGRACLPILFTRLTSMGSSLCTDPLHWQKIVYPNILPRCQPSLSKCHYPSFILSSGRMHPAFSRRPVTAKEQGDLTTLSKPPIWWKDLRILNGELLH